MVIMSHRYTALLSILWLAACGSVPGTNKDAGCPNCDAASTTIDGGPQADAGPNADAGADPDASQPRTVAQQLVSVRDLDILFVVDNSGSMAEEQASLTANFGRFISTLRTIEGGLPNLHIGVVSTDVGAGPYNISGCSGFGDRGVLQSVPRGACAAPTGAYLSDVSNGSGGRTINYSGTLEESFTCIAQLGIDGCGFEQPLESMRRALNCTNTENAGFLRPNAALAVIIIADEDDCSASDTTMYDTSQTSISDPLGPLSSFRCFEFGVVCDDDSPRNAGVKTGCVPRADSRYMYGMTEYADFLRSLKADPSLVTVGVISGVAEPVKVGITDMATPKLEASCVSASGDAAPAVRLLHFASLFPNRHTKQTICNDDLSAALIGTANNLGASIGGACLVNTPADTAPGTPGLQSDCRVADVTGFGTASETVVQTIPDCATSSTGACFRLITASTQCTGVEAQIDRRGTTRPSNTVPGIWCSAE